MGKNNNLDKLTTQDVQNSKGARKDVIHYTQNHWERLTEEAVALLNEEVQDLNERISDLLNGRLKLHE